VLWGLRWRRTTAAVVTAFALLVTDIPGDVGNSESVSSLVVQGGKIVAAGSARTFGERSLDFVLTRYEANGALDATFGSDGIVTTDFAAAPDSATDEANALAAQADGTLVAAGFASTQFSIDIALARYLP
jgi:uncharacterized delta-60 repeat protein